MTNQLDDAKLAADERRDGWRTVMSTRPSRRVVWESFEVFGIYQAPVSLDPQVLAHDAGRRSVALQLMHDLLVQCPELYDLMVTENRERKQREQFEEQQRSGAE